MLFIDFINQYPYGDIKKMGSTYRMECVFHDDRHPSAYFKEDWDHAFCPVCRKNIYPQHILYQQGYSKQDAMKILNGDRDLYDNPFVDTLPDLRINKVCKIHSIQHIKHGMSDRYLDYKAYVKGDRKTVRVSDFIAEKNKKEAVKMDRRVRKKKIAYYEKIQQIFHDASLFQNEVSKLQQDILKK